MKQLIMFIALVLGMLSFQSFNTMTIRPLDLTVGIIKIKPGGTSMPRNPVIPPIVAIDGHTVYFDTDHAAFTVMLVDEDEQVVYQVAVPSTVDEIELPSTLSGVFELQIYDGTDYYFYCDIYLE